MAVTIEREAAAAQLSRASRGLRAWLEEDERMGELRHVQGASVEEDIGAATDVLQHTAESPAALFEEIPGFDASFRVLVNSFGSTDRIALTLGLPLGLSKSALSDAWRQKIRGLRPIPAVEVKDGPILENVRRGDEIDMTIFPTPKWHPGDGGRYIGTGSFDVTRDPDDGWVNVGTYRVMVHDQRRLGYYISPGKHGRLHRQKYFDRGQPCPVVMVFGTDPLQFLAGCTEIPVEGFATDQSKLVEGPFGEWMGYYGSGSREEPVLMVEALYYRNAPILVGSPPGQPPDEQARYRAVLRTALLRDELEKMGIPDVVSAWCHEVGGSRLFNVIAITQRYPGHARQVAHAAASCRAGAYAGRYVVVVDEDIDPSSLEEVMWAVCTRSDPATSIDIVHRSWSTPLDPRIPPEKRSMKDFTNSRGLIDATRPFEWRNNYAPVNVPPREV